MAEVTTFRKQLILTSFLVLAFSPTIIYLEILTKPFWRIYIEEFFGRFIPLTIVYLTYPKGRLIDRIVVGIVAGLTFGLVEIAVKTDTLGMFSPLMFIPVAYVHCVNGMIASLVIGESVENKWWSLLPLGFIIPAFWHSLYNVGLVGFV